MCFDKYDYKVFKNELNNFGNLIEVEEKPIKRNCNIFDKILFGTDFSINLMSGAKSYQEYIESFTKQNYFDKKQKQNFSEINPHNFLFE